MFDFLFGKDTDVYLMNQQSFSSRYQLTTQSCFVMGKENPPIHVSSTATVDLKQTVEKKKIFTTVSFVEMTSETDHNNFKESLREAQLFTKINPVIEVLRDEHGRVKNISNLPDMWNDWERWKKKQLPLVVPDERKQEKIIKNYENGLKSLEYNFNKNFQYMLLLPECYKFRGYSNPQDVSSGKTYSSRFVEKLDIFYRLNKKSFSDKNNSNKNNIVKLTLGTRISDDAQKLIERQLVPFYENNMPDFSLKDYFFDINVEYTLDKNTSEIMDAKLSFMEKLHPNFTYTMELNLNQVTKDTSPSDKTQTSSATKDDLSIPPAANEKNKRKWSTLLDDDDDNWIIG